MSSPVLGAAKALNSAGQALGVAGSAVSGYGIGVDLRQGDYNRAAVNGVSAALGIASLATSLAPPVGLALGGASLLIGANSDAIAGWLDGQDWNPLNKLEKPKRADGVNSCDPNAMVGPAGYGPGFVQPLGSYPYRIYFENHPDEASAAAQEVFITHQLDSDLDWNTFELGELNWGLVTIAVPHGADSYHAQVEYHNPDGSPLIVDVDVTFNAQTGIVAWALRSVDPETGLVPVDALAGFLPPNDEHRSGEGFVSFSVRQKPGLGTGTEINAKADIVFDLNAPVTTNTWTNIIDADGPTSSVAALAAADPNPVRVRWSGVDDAGGSGVATYDIFVSADGGPFSLWLDDTTALTAQYDGIIGHTYAFYSVATDNVGHVEAAPQAADTFTLVVPPLEPGDYDGDKIVDADDYNLWRSSFGQAGLESCGRRQ